jgi:hypothetical protein
LAALGACETHLWSCFAGANKRQGRKFNARKPRNLLTQDRGLIEATTKKAAAGQRYGHDDVCVGHEIGPGFDHPASQ